jgi:hypothetical protein
MTAPLTMLTMPTTPFRHAALLGALLASTLPAQAAERPIRVDIAPGKVGEVCMPLEAGDTLTWRFKASAPVDFNLHQHIDKEVLTPVERKAVAADRSSHQVDRKNEWCLMWTAPADRRATVNGGWRVAKATPAAHVAK